MLIPEPMKKCWISMRSFRITLFFQDPMSGIFDYHVKESRCQYKILLPKHTEMYEGMCKKQENISFYSRFMKKLAAVLADKADLGMCIKSAYRFIQEIRTILTEWFWFPFAVTNQLQLHYRI